MNIYQILVRIFTAAAVVVSLFSGDIEYRTALTILSGIYIFLFLLIPKGQSSKYVFLIVDILFISFAIYLTGQTYLSILIVPLFSEFVKDQKDVLFFSVFSSIPVLTALYISNFSEFLFIPIILAGVMGTAGLYRAFTDREKYFNELKNEMENLYIKNISFQEAMEDQSRLLELYESLKKMRENRFPLKVWIYDINERLGTDGIIFFDIANNRCYSTGDANCSKELLRYIDAPVVNFQEHRVNEILDAEKVVGITIEDRDNIYGIIFIASKLKEIDLQALQLIKDQLTLYFLELQEEPSQKNSSIGTGREKETDSD
ncbi:hypothetical protein [Persephonella sp.]